jgi:hypothetical protein
MLLEAVERTLLGLDCIAVEMEIVIECQDMGVHDLALVETCGAKVTLLPMPERMMSCKVSRSSGFGDTTSC